MGDILTLSAPATVTLNGIWNGTLTGDGSPYGSSTATLDILLRSLTYDTLVPDGEGGLQTVSTSDQYGRYQNQLFAPTTGDFKNHVNAPFSITATLPAGAVLLPPR
jgi:hypothetical protein